MQYATKIGTYTLAKEPSEVAWGHAFPTADSNDSVINGSGLYTITYQVTLDQDIDSIEYFEIDNLWFDDCVLIRVNDEKLLNLPVDNSNSLDNQSQCNNGQDFEKAAQGIKPTSPLDIKSYLKQGLNTIRIDLRVIGGGGLYFNMTYKIKG